jgi:hypothetical protein
VLTLVQRSERPRTTPNLNPGDVGADHTHHAAIEHSAQACSQLHTLQPAASGTASTHTLQQIRSYWHECILSHPHFPERPQLQGRLEFAYLKKTIHIAI